MCHSSRPLHPSLRQETFQRAPVSCNNAGRLPPRLAKDWVQAEQRYQKLIKEMRDAANRR